ncbi:hypothetical protein HG530_013705 [Fusarium avenaceum]|nr:hypothetical protein HG530_013705 [Fusarium avenaceum]
MLNITDLAVNADVHPSHRVLRIRKARLGAILFQQRRIGVRNRCGQVQDTSDRNGITECTRIRADEGWAGVSETGSTAESKLKCLLQVETAKDHCLVTISELRLHNICSRHLGFGHGDNVRRLTKLIVWVVVCKLSQPDLMDQGGLSIVWFSLEKRNLGYILLRKLKSGDGDGFSCVGIQSYHGEGAGEEDILGLAWLAFLSRLCDFASDLNTTSARSICDLAAVFKVTNLSERVCYGDTVQGSGHCGNARTGVFVDDDAREGVKIHEQRSESAHLVSL